MTKRLQAVLRPGETQSEIARDLTRSGARTRGEIRFDGSPARCYIRIMPQAVIPRTVNYPPEVFQAIDEYRISMGMKSWSAAMLAIVAEWQAYRAQGKRP
jgi:hypothetical protein